jgi:hypothetical protein
MPVDASPPALAGTGTVIKLSELETKNSPLLIVEDRYPVELQAIESQVHLQRKEASTISTNISLVPADLAISSDNGVGTSSTDNLNNDGIFTILGLPGISPHDGQPCRGLISSWLS